LAGNPKVWYVTVKVSGFVWRVKAGKLLRTPMNINSQENRLFDDIFGLMSEVGQIKEQSTFVTKHQHLFFRDTEITHFLLALLRAQNLEVLPMPPLVPYGLRGLPSRLWPKCN
jgi:hypothetical protein